MVLLCSWSAVSPGAAAPLIEVFPLPAGNSRPVAVTVAEDGSVWFTDPGIDVVGRITESGALTLLALPSPSGPAGIASDGDGGIWFTQNDRNAIGRFSLAPPHDLEELLLSTPAAQPFAIAIGLAGDVWFTTIGGNQIGHIAADRTITEYVIPTALAVPAGIAVADDGGVWFTEFNRNQVGRLDPDGSFMEIPLPNPGSAPFGIVVDASNTAFFTQFNGNRVGRIAPEGAYSEFSVPTTSSQPAGITIAADGAVWFTQVNVDQIAVLAGDLIHEFELPEGSFDAGTLFGGGIAGGPGNRLTFAATRAAAVDRADLCMSDQACASLNCETFLCGPPHTPTPTNGVRSCRDDERVCQLGFVCNLAEGGLCCEMRECPVGFSCRVPGREGFCTALPTTTPTATHSPAPVATATISATATTQPTVTMIPTETPTFPIEPTSTPTSKSGGGGSGCNINAATPALGTWFWLLPIALLRAVGRGREAVP
jgi:streptogramin lyase